MKFRKRPVLIEAIQYMGVSTNPSEFDRIREFVGEALIPYIIDHQRETLGIRTLEGVMNVSRGDWVIKGVAGEFYPCKPDIFAQTYESEEEFTKLQVQRETEIKDLKEELYELGKTSLEHHDRALQLATHVAVLRAALKQSVKVRDEALRGNLLLQGCTQEQANARSEIDGTLVMAREALFHTVSSEE